MWCNTKMKIHECERMNLRIFQNFYFTITLSTFKKMKGVIEIVLSKNQFKLSRRSIRPSLFLSLRLGNTIVKTVLINSFLAHAHFPIFPLNAVLLCAPNLLHYLLCIATQREAIFVSNPREDYTTKHCLILYNRNCSCFYTCIW